MYVSMHASMYVSISKSVCFFVRPSLHSSICLCIYAFSVYVFIYVCMFDSKYVRPYACVYVSFYPSMYVCS